MPFSEEDEQRRTRRGGAGRRGGSAGGRDCPRLRRRPASVSACCQLKPCHLHHSGVVKPNPFVEDELLRRIVKKLVSEEENSFTGFAQSESVLLKRVASFLVETCLRCCFRCR